MNWPLSLIYRQHTNSTVKRICGLHNTSAFGGRISNKDGHYITFEQPWVEGSLRDFKKTTTAWRGQKFPSITVSFSFVTSISHPSHTLDGSSAVTVYGMPVGAVFPIVPYELDCEETWVSSHSTPCCCSTLYLRTALSRDEWSLGHILWQRKPTNSSRRTSNTNTIHRTNQL